MDRLRAPREELDSLVPYDAKDIEAEVCLHANENPSDLPGELIDRLASRLRTVGFNRYPDPLANRLRDMIAEANGLERGNVMIGNGGDELIFDLLLAWGGPGRKLIDLPPTFSMYAIDGVVTGTEVVSIARRAEDFSVDEEAVMKRVGEGDIDIVVVSNPNNPTGDLVPETFLIDLLNATDSIVLVDEAYFEFSRHTMRPHMDRHANLVILRTFSKAFSMAGLRVGYLLGHADVVTELTKVRQPYAVDRLAQTVARMVFKERAAFEAGIRDIIRRRDVLLHGLSSLSGLTVYRTEANFVLFRVEHASAVWRDLLHSHSVLVRDFSRTPGLEDCLRVTVGTDEEIGRFLAAMDEILATRRAADHFGASARARRHENGDGD